MFYYVVFWYFVLVSDIFDAQSSVLKKFAKLPIRGPAAAGLGAEARGEAARRGPALTKDHKLCTINE